MRALASTCIVLCLALSPCAVTAQDTSCPLPDAAAGVGIVVGRVLDLRTGVPLGAARVELRAPGIPAPLRAETGLDGYVRFCSVPSGEVVLSASMGERRGAVGPAVLEPGGALELVLELWSPIEDAGTLGGEVVDTDAGNPVEGARVMLPELGLSAISNALGRFVFPSVRPGSFALEVRRLGYADAKGMVEIEGGKTTETRVSLAVEAISIEPIVVTAVRRRVQLPDLEDFERRYFSGWGKFVLEEEIRLRNPSKLTQVLDQTGVDVFGNGVELITRRTGCAPMVYIDNVKVTRLPRGGGRPTGRVRANERGGLYPWPDPEASPSQEAAEAVNLVHPSEVLAVEVYRGPAETPGEYIDSNSACGVILIWTRRGHEVRER